MPRGATDTGAHASDLNARQHHGCRWQPGAGGVLGSSCPLSPHPSAPQPPCPQQGLPGKKRLRQQPALSGSASSSPLLSSAWHTSLPGLKITPISSASCSPSPAGLCPAPPAPAQPWQGCSRGCEGCAGRELDQGEHSGGWHLPPLQHSSPCSPQKGQGHRAGPATAHLPFGLTASLGSGLVSAFFGAVLSRSPTLTLPGCLQGWQQRRGDGRLTFLECCLHLAFASSMVFARGPVCTPRVSVCGCVQEHACRHRRCTQGLPAASRHRQPCAPHHGPGSALGAEG